jgi:hypothetical protein
MRSARANCLVTFRRPWKVPFSLLAWTIRALGGGLITLRLSKGLVDNDEAEEEEEEGEDDDENIEKDIDEEDEDESSKLLEGMIDIFFPATTILNLSQLMLNKSCLFFSNQLFSTIIL